MCKGCAQKTVVKDEERTARELSPFPISDEEGIEGSSGSNVTGKGGQRVWICNGCQRCHSALVDGRCDDDNMASAGGAGGVVVVGGGGLSAFTNDHRMISGGHGSPPLIPSPQRSPQRSSQRSPQGMMPQQNQQQNQQQQQEQQQQEQEQYLRGGGGLSAPAPPPLSWEYLCLHYSNYIRIMKAQIFPR